MSTSNPRPAQSRQTSRRCLLLLALFAPLAACGGGADSSGETVAPLARATADGATNLDLVVASGALAGARLEVPAHAIDAGATVTLRAGAAIAAAAATPAGPALAVTIEGGALGGLAQVTLPFEAGTPPADVVVLFEPAATGAASTGGAGALALYVPPRVEVDAVALRARFALRGLASGVLQVARRGAPAFDEVTPVAVPASGGALLEIAGSGFATTSAARVGGAALASAAVAGGGLGLSGLAPAAPAGSALEIDLGPFAALPDALTVFAGSRVLDAKSGQFGAIPVERSSGTATTLEDGRVLVAGGQVEIPNPNGSSPAVVSVATETCYLFDPATDTLLPAGALAAPRFTHQAVRLDDGRVAVLGGSTKDAGNQQVAHTTVEVYDPAANAWTTLPALALAPRCLTHGVFRLPNGDWLVAGGFVDTAFSARTSALEVLDPGLSAVAVSAATTTRTTPVQLASGDLVLVGDAVSFATSNQVEVVALAANAAQLPSLQDPVAAVTGATGALANAYGTPSIARFPADDRLLVVDRSTTAPRIEVVTVTPGAPPAVATLSIASLLASDRRRSGVAIRKTADGALFVGPGAFSSSDTKPLADLYVPGPPGDPGRFIPLAVGERRAYMAASLRDDRVLLVGGRAGALGGGALRPNVEVVERELLALASLDGEAHVVCGFAPSSGLALAPGDRLVRAFASGALDPRDAQGAAVSVRVNGLPRAVAAATIDAGDPRALVIDLGASPALAPGDVVDAEVQGPLRGLFGRALDLGRGAPSARWTVR